MITIKQQGKTTIRCDFDTKKKLMYIKIRTNKESLEHVLKDLIKRYSKR